MSDQIEWRDIPGYKGRYQVSDAGQVRRIESLKGHPAGEFKTKPNQTGYVIVCLTTSGKKKYMHAHRLVMLAFVGECPKGIDVNHKNGIRHDNRLENLEYVTRSENMQHAINVLGSRTGNYLGKPNLKSRGELHGNASLDEKTVRKIREMVAAGMMQKDMMHLFGATQQNISAIVNRKTWKHIE